VIYAKQPLGGPKQVINYLGRYTHRTAISNDRSLRANTESVTFTWKDYKNNYAKRTTTLPGEGVLRLSCMHILPPGFTRIRHYGFLSSAPKRKSLSIIRTFLNVVPQCAPTSRPWQEIALERMGMAPGICKGCGGNMQVIQRLSNRFQQKQRAPPDKHLQKLTACQSFCLKNGILPNGKGMACRHQKRHKTYLLNAKTHQRSGQTSKYSRFGQENAIRVFHFYLPKA
jgi:hypothetical protein